MLRAILLALLLVTGPIQAQLLYACHAPDGMAGPCCGDQSDSMAMSPRCDTEGAPRILLFCMEPVVHADVVPTSDKSPLEHDSARAPPPALGPPPSDILSALPFATASPPTPPTAAPAPLGTDTYLLTLRLRI